MHAKALADDIVLSPYVAPCSNSNGEPATSHDLALRFHVESLLSDVWCCFLAEIQLAQYVQGGKAG